MVLGVPASAQPGDLMGHLSSSPPIGEPRPNELLLVVAGASRPASRSQRRAPARRNIAPTSSSRVTVRRCATKTEIHDRLTQASLGDDGVQEPSRPLHQLTGLTATTRDPRRRLFAWAGGRPGPAPGAAPRARNRRCSGRCAGHRIRADGRLLVVARPRPDVVGVPQCHHDREKTTGERGSVALEAPSMVLAGRAGTRQHGLAETRHAAPRRDLGRPPDEARATGPISARRQPRARPAPSAPRRRRTRVAGPPRHRRRPALLLRVRRNSAAVSACRAAAIAPSSEGTRPSLHRHRAGRRRAAGDRSRVARHSITSASAVGRHRRGRTTRARSVRRPRRCRNRPAPGARRPVLRT